MATMNRNVNLEEVNSDAFMGIPFLNYQSIPQKVTFWGCLLLAVIWNILATFAFHINANIIIVSTLIPLSIGIAFGCNYNQDLSLLRYAKLVLFKPRTVYVFKPFEDIEQVREASIKLDKRDELETKKKNMTPETQRKLLIRMLLGVLGMILFFVIILIIIALTNDDVMHHLIQ